MSLCSIQYGPWTPDLANVPAEISPQGTSPVPVADCLNVYYADGTYKNLEGAVSQALLTSSSAPLGAFTATDPLGNPFILAGTQTALYLLPQGSSSFASANSGFNAVQWRFAQFQASVYAVDGNAKSADPMQVATIDGTTSIAAGVINFTGSISGNVLTVTSINAGSDPNSQFQVGTVIQSALLLGVASVVPGTNIVSLGTGTGGTGTYNLTPTPNLGSQSFQANVPPVGSVLATVGQFLMLGNIGQQFSILYTLASGTSFTTSVAAVTGNPYLIRPGSFSITDGTHSTTDNGMGSLIPTSFYAGGTVNYASASVTVNFVNTIGGTFTLTFTQCSPERVWWSAINLPSFFPAPLTNTALAFQSSYEDLESDLGPVTGIFGYPLYALIFQKSGITRAIYQGGNVVFSFGTYEWKRGLLTPSASVQVGPNVYFLSDQGFFYTDGSNVYPIGTAPNNAAGIDKWFWANVNYAALSSISGAYDASRRAVIFAICTGSNTVPDTLLIYNILAQQWTRAQSVPCTVIWTDIDGTRHRIGVFGQNNAGTYAYEILTGSPASGAYLESCDLTFSDGLTRTVMGVRPNIACTDTPLVTLGNRNTLQGSVNYSAATAPDAFGAGFAGVISEGLYTRVRVSSGAATAINGATIDAVVGGSV